MVFPSFAHTKRAPRTIEDVLAGFTDADKAIAEATEKRGQALDDLFGYVLDEMQKSANARGYVLSLVEVQVTDARTGAVLVDRQAADAAAGWIADLMRQAMVHNQDHPIPGAHDYEGYDGQQARVRNFSTTRAGGRYYNRTNKPTVTLAIDAPQGKKEIGFERSMRLGDVAAIACKELGCPGNAFDYSLRLPGYPDYLPCDLALADAGVRDLDVLELVDHTGPQEPLMRIKILDVVEGGYSREWAFHADTTIESVILSIAADRGIADPSDYCLFREGADGHMLMRLSLAEHEVADGECLCWGKLRGELPNVTPVFFSPSTYVPLEIEIENGHGLPVPVSRYEIGSNTKVWDFLVRFRDQDTLGMSKVRLKYKNLPLQLGKTFVEQGVKHGDRLQVYVVPQETYMLTIKGQEGWNFPPTPFDVDGWSNARAAFRGMLDDIFGKGVLAPYPSFYVQREDGVLINLDGPIRAMGVQDGDVLTVLRV